MSSRTFDRETLLDLIVNAIPLAMMAFFVGVFVLYNPFGTDLANQAIQLSLVTITFGALLVLTYFSGRAISKAEEELEEEEPEESEAVTSDEPPEGAAAVAADELVDDEPTDDE